MPRRSEVPDASRGQADEDVRAAQHEQWDDGTNYLAVAPGVVMGYERNVATNTTTRASAATMDPTTGRAVRVMVPP